MGYQQLQSNIQHFTYSFFQELFGQTKKYVCFRLPTVPKFSSPTLIIFIVIYGF